MYTSAAFAKQVGVCVKTLQKWDRIEVLPAKRAVTNRRYYTDEDLVVALRQPRKPKADRRTIGYCRVSSQAQKPNLVNQQKFLEQFYGESEGGACGRRCGNGATAHLLEEQGGKCWRADLAGLALVSLDQTLFRVWAVGW